MTAINFNQFWQASISDKVGYFNTRLCHFKGHHKACAADTFASALVNSSLTSHNLLATSVSYEALLEAWGLQSTQYLELNPSTSGEEARKMLVAAPCAGVFRKTLAAFSNGTCHQGTGSGTRYLHEACTASVRLSFVEVS